MTIPFRATDALDAAIWARAAYGDVPLPDGYQYGVNAQMIDLMPKVDVQVLVARGNGKLVIAPRGTKDIRGWMVDASVGFHTYLPAICKGVKMHSGFYGTVDAVWPMLIPTVRQAVKDGLKIYIPCHSKGAGEGCILTLRLAVEESIFTTERISFGEPRSLNRAGARVYDSLGIPTYRMIDEGDGVCRIPLMLGLYRHVQTSAFIDAWLNIDLGEPWWAHWPSDTASAIRELMRFKLGVAYDHGMDIYIQRLSAIVQAQGLKA